MKSIVLRLFAVMLASFSVVNLALLVVGLPRVIEFLSRTPIAGRVAEWEWFLPLLYVPGGLGIAGAVACWALSMDRVHRGSYPALQREESATLRGNTSVALFEHETAGERQLRIQQLGQEHRPFVAWSNYQKYRNAGDEEYRNAAVGTINRILVSWLLRFFVVGGSAATGTLLAVVSLLLSSVMVYLAQGTLEETQTQTEEMRVQSAQMKQQNKALLDQIRKEESARNISRRSQLVALLYDTSPCPSTLPGERIKHCDSLFSSCEDRIDECEKRSLWGLGLCSEKLERPRTCIEEDSSCVATLAKEALKACRLQRTACEDAAREESCPNASTRTRTEALIGFISLEEETANVTRQKQDCVPFDEVEWPEPRDVEGGKRLDLTAIDLEGASIPGVCLTRALMSSAKLRGADLSDTYMVMVGLSKASLQGAFLFNTYMMGSQLVGANVAGAKFTRARMQRVFLQHVVGEEASFFEAKLNGSRITRGNLRGATFQDADMRESWLAGTDFEGASFEGANLEYADFSYIFPTLMNYKDHAKAANLKGVNMKNAKLKGAVLHGVDLRSVVLEGANVEDSCWNEKTQWPDGLKPSVPQPKYCTK